MIAKLQKRRTKYSIREQEASSGHDDTHLGATEEVVDEESST